MRNSAIAAAIIVALASCKKDQPASTTSTPAAPRLVLKFKFDSTQTRLNAFGQPEPAIAAGHGAQCPHFHKMSAHYVEFALGILTPLGGGDVVYHAPETTAGGASAIDFAQSVKVGDGETFFSMPLSQMDTGTYNWLRVSLAYQNYDVRYRFTDSLFGALDLTGTIASFIGYNTYITSYPVNTQTVTVNGNRLQGYWAFETLGQVFNGQAPPGATTVVNPLFATSPIPAGSCVATGQFAQPLHITGQETHDVTIVVSLSVNKSFEWKDHLGDNIFEPLAGDTVIDMGVRGLIPIVQ